MTTVRELVEAARIRHWAFTELELPDGAALLQLNQRQRTLLARYGAQIEGLVTRSVQLAASLALDGVGSVLVGDDGDGITPITIDTTLDGQAVHLDSVDGWPFVETTDEPIAIDPFGSSGGTLGWPLPADFIRLTNFVLVLDTNRMVDCDIAPEKDRLETAQRRHLVAFISGNRVVPALPMTTGNPASQWDSVVGVQLSYVAMQTLGNMTDLLTLPAVLVEALIASLANQFARQAKDLSASERNGFKSEEVEAERALGTAADEMLGDVTTNTVIFRP